jgi:hypothetical protein
MSEIELKAVEGRHCGVDGQTQSDARKLATNEAGDFGAPWRSDGALDVPRRIGLAFGRRCARLAT